MLANRRIVLGVSGGIAAYKAVEICRRLVDAGAHVSPVLTQDALRFVGCAHVLGARVRAGAHHRSSTAPEPIPHTRLGQSADLVIVAPATAKLLGKYAAGISDDLLTATLLATRAPVLVAPAMHTEMWEHPAVQDNLATLRRRGVHVVDPASGRLAGGDVGEGRLADPADIVAAADALLASTWAATGVIWPASACSSPPAAPVSRSTRCAIITNRSSGKQGYALAEVAARRGADVTLVTTIGRPAPLGVEIVSVQTAAEMQEAVLDRATECRRDRDGGGGRRLPAQGTGRTASSRSTRASPRSCSSPPTTSSSTSVVTRHPVRCWSGSRRRPTTWSRTRPTSCAPSASISSSATTSPSPMPGSRSTPTGP